MKHMILSFVCVFSGPPLFVEACVGMQDVPRCYLHGRHVHGLRRYATARGCAAESEHMVQATSRKHVQRLSVRVVHEPGTDSDVMCGGPHLFPSSLFPHRLLDGYDTSEPVKLFSYFFAVVDTLIL